MAAEVWAGKSDALASVRNKIPPDGLSEQELQNLLLEEVSTLTT